MVEGVSVPCLILLQILGIFFVCADSVMCVAFLVPEMSARNGAKSR